MRLLNTVVKKKCQLLTFLISCKKLQKREW